MTVSSTLLAVAKAAEVAASLWVSCNLVEEEQEEQSASLDEIPHARKEIFVKLGRIERG